MKLLDIYKAIDQSPRLDFGNILSESIEIFKKVWLQGFLMLLLSMAFIIPLYFMLFIPAFVSGNFDPEAFENLEFMSVAGRLWFIIGLAVFLIVVITIATLLQAGFYRVCRIKDLNSEQFDSLSLLYFFKSKYIKKSFLIGLLSVVISLVAVLLLILPLIYVSVPLGFVILIFVFNPDLSIEDTFKVAFKLGHKKWWLTFLTALVAGLMAEVVGLLLCLVGVFFTISFAYLPYYVIYKHTIGFEDFENTNSNPKILT